ncbi:MAG: ABC transporter ATP-binding protein [Candidatus Aminicenantaceae bacterium]
MKQLMKLFKLVLFERRRLALSLVCTLMVALFTLGFVNLVQPIIDYMMSPSDVSENARFTLLVMKAFHITRDQLVQYLPWILVGVMFGRGFFTFLSSFFMQSIGIRVVRRMRDDLYRSLINQSADYFDRRSTGELMSRLTSDVDRIQDALSGSAKDFIQEAFVLLALIITVFVIDWKLALATMIVTPLAVILIAVFSRQLKRIGKQNQIKMANIFSLLHESITGRKIVKAFTMEEFEIKKFMEATRNLYRTAIKLAWIGSLSSPFMEFLGGLLGAFILLVGSQRIAAGYITSGEFGTFMFAILSMYMPIRKISRANNTMQHGVACLERVEEVMLSRPTIIDKPEAPALPPVKGNVMFEDVTFSYDSSRPVLCNISFTVMPTEMIALVGLSGSGKTTIINLLSRFYETTSGRIKIDDRDIRDVSLSSLRSQIGLVTQELILFNDTVRNNIAYGLADTPDEDVIRAATAAEAHGFISVLPQGYDTQIGEKGGLLSSGQKQRLSIARALLKDPPILILDEATSALDAESEQQIQIALANVMKDRTTIVIAHRLSTIRNADRIFVIDKGTIAEIGTHEELVQQNGIYRKLSDLQFPEKKEGSP